MRYHLSYPPDIEPADLVISRIANELSARAITVRDLTWVKTMAQQIKARKKEEKITETLRHVTSDLAVGSDTGDVESYLAALLTLWLGMAKAGCEFLPAQSPPFVDESGVDETKLIEVPLSLMFRN